MAFVPNRLLLQAIHASKNSYCWFLSPEYSDYDVVTQSLDRLTEGDLEAARLRQARAGRTGPLIIRVMSDRHIPIDPAPEPRRRRDPNGEPLRVKLCFPAFQHFRQEQDGSLTLVGRSHWRGSPEDGRFSGQHGRMTDDLARLILRLVEGYGRKANWRSYSYVDEMQAQAVAQLSQVLLQFDESKGSNAFAYSVSVITNSFRRVLALEKRVTDIRDDLLIQAGASPSFARQVADEAQQRGEEP